MSIQFARLSWSLAILLTWGIMVVPARLQAGDAVEPTTASAIAAPAKDPTMDWITIVSNLGLPIALVLWFLRKDKSREEETAARTKALEDQVKGMQQKQLDMAENRQKDTAKTVERVTEALEQNSNILTSVGRTLRGMLDILQSHRCMVSGHNPANEPRPETREVSQDSYRRVRSVQDIPAPPVGEDSDQNISEISDGLKGNRHGSRK